MNALGEIFKISKGKKAIESSFETTLRYIQIGDLRNDDVMKYTTQSSTNVLCTKDDILIAWDGANAGTVGYNLEGVVGSTLAKLSPKKEGVHINYVGRFLQSKFEYLRENCTGATIPHLSRPVLENLQIPLPPLEQQKKIAAILDAADAYRQKTKALIAKYDELTQSLFLDMFGDPVKNDKGWDKEELKKLGKVITGSTPPSSKKNMFGGNIPFVTPRDLDKHQPYKRFVTEEGALNSRTVNKGSLFVCCIGATIGKTGIARELSSFNQQINAVSWDRFINSHFGYNCFFYLKNELITKAISTTLPIMKKSDFEKLKMIVPPINLQNQFAERVKAIETQKAKSQASLEKAEELFNSLLQRAFKGELV
jgi:type I restriction enzyme S subunit